MGEFWELFKKIAQAKFLQKYLSQVSIYETF